MRIVCFFASNYFEQMYECAVLLIKKGKAFVCDLTADQIREYRGISPHQERKALTETVPLRKICSSLRR